MINYDNPPFKRISGIRSNEEINKEMKQEMFLDMMLQDFKEGNVTQEKITETLFDLEEMPLTWEASISDTEERGYARSLSKTPSNSNKE